MTYSSFQDTSFLHDASPTITQSSPPPALSLACQNAMHCSGSYAFGKAPCLDLEHQLNRKERNYLGNKLNSLKVISRLAHVCQSITLNVAGALVPHLFIKASGQSVLLFYSIFSTRKKQNTEFVYSMGLTVSSLRTAPHPSYILFLKQ